MSDVSERGIRIEQLTKTYGRFKALQRVDLSVPEGEYLTVVGPNGAGKSTLLGVIAGLIRPTRGTVRIDGRDVMRERDETDGRKIGVLSYHTYLYDDLTVRENLTFYGRLYGVSRLQESIALLLEQVGMARRAESPVRTLSRGMKQRASLARALLHDPSVLLLDEPYTGLDQEAMDMLHQFLSVRRRTVFLVTHDLHRGLEVADRIVIMAGGRIVCDTPCQDMSPEAFEQLYRKHTA
ncbi:MAG: heme ABC exporter ATP-binding protein CcmA [candidate division Zixibacteria bacterium]|nr:heme ABC exporter ATP-binding protein CcmA [candidate division Zixibacteria bacterium]